MWRKLYFTLFDHKNSKKINQDSTRRHCKRASVSITYAFVSSCFRKLGDEGGIPLGLASLQARVVHPQASPCSISWPSPGVCSFLEQLRQGFLLPTGSLFAQAHSRRHRRRSRHRRPSSSTRTCLPGRSSSRAPPSPSSSSHRCCAIVARA